jgi:hypothetical protein
MDCLVLKQYEPTHLVEHPLWQFIKPHMKVEACAQDGGPMNPRYRYEVKTLPAWLEPQALLIQIPCCKCGKLIHPIRRREGENQRADSGPLYYAVACPQSENRRCSRGKAASAAYERMKKELLG